MTGNPRFESKVTARIDRDLYSAVQDHFHHGQITKMLRCIFLSLKKLIDTKKFDSVYDYLYNNKDLTLPGVKE